MTNALYGNFQSEQLLSEELTCNFEVFLESCFLAFTHVGKFSTSLEILFDGLKETGAPSLDAVNFFAALATS